MFNELHETTQMLFWLVVLILVLKGWASPPKVFNTLNTHALIESQVRLGKDPLTIHHDVRQLIDN